MSLSEQDLRDIRTIVTDGIAEALNEIVNPRFDRIEAKLDEHDQQFARIETHLTEHDQQFARIETHLTEHDQQFARIETHLTEHDRRFDGIDRSLDDLDGRLKALEDDVKELYGMTALPPVSRAGKSPEQRLRHLYADMLTLARELHVEL